MIAARVGELPTILPPRNAVPLMAWRHYVSAHHDQLTHAVAPGSATAECGVVVEDVGAPWPEPAAGTPLSRCAICAQAVQGIWKGTESRPDAR